MRSGKIPVYLGGPVGAHEWTSVSFDWVAGEAKITFHSQLSLDQVQPWLEVVRSLATPVGQGGQLESELQQSAWIVNPATESILGNASNDETWLDLIKISEVAYHLLAIAPDDPSLS